VDVAPDAESIPKIVSLGAVISGLIDPGLVDVAAGAAPEALREILDKNSISKIPSDIYYETRQYFLLSAI
jgi:hypothetical protein